MSIIWWLLIVIVLAFALFAGDSTLRMRSDVKLIREVVLDMRSKMRASSSRWPAEEAADDDDDSTSTAPAITPPTRPAAMETAPTSGGDVAQPLPPPPPDIPPPPPPAPVQENFRDWHP